MVVEIEALRTATKSVLRDIAKHANTLAVGLQNAAPAQASGPAKSVLYLTEIAKQLDELTHKVDDASSTSV